MNKTIGCLIFGCMIGCCVTVKAQIKKASPSGMPPDTAKVVAPSEKSGTVKKGEEQPIISVVEQMPEFPGGQNSLMGYLSRNLRYPESALNAEIQGRVYVKFVVCTDGSLCDEEIVKGVDTALNEEVLRVVRAMPRWKPGMYNGKAVKTYYTLPVTFKLEDDAEKKTSENRTGLQETK